MFYLVPDQWIKTEIVWFHLVSALFILQTNFSVTCIFFFCLDSTQDGSGGALDDTTDQEAIYVQIKKFQVCIILFQCFFVCDMGESNICQYFVFLVNHFCPVFWICIFHQCLPSFQWLMVNYYRLCQNTCKQPYCVIQMKVNFCTDFHAVCMMYM